MSYRRLRPRVGYFVVAFAALVASPAAHSTERVQQLAEDGVATRYMNSAKAQLTAAPHQICEPGARWIRLSFGELALSAYDSLTVVGSSGERQVFEGDAFGGRSFATRALRGECVSVEPTFSNAASRYRVESYQFGTRALEMTTVVVAGAGDICDTNGTTCKGTSDLIVGINPTAVFTAGDNAYSNGTLSEYNARYAPSWGRFKALTSPTPGNHEYNTSGASGYFDYFNGSGAQTGPAGDRSKGYYSWDVGDWHFIALNTMSGGTIAQAQLNWLQSDLAANTKPCTAAYFHHPLLSVGNYSGYSQVKPIWDRLYAAHADLVLVGHDHNYQRYALMKPDKTADSAGGIRQVLVGTGGRSFYGISGSHPLLEKSNANSHGVLKLTLTATGYTGEFVRSTGSFTDSFSGSCHNATPPPNAAPIANFSFATNSLVANFTDASTDSDGTIASRSWTFGDGTTSTATNPSRTYAAAGTYTVTLTVTDNRGATGTTNKSVSVTAPTNTPPVANFSTSVSGRNVTFTDGSSDSDGSIVSRSWNFGDGATSTATNTSHAYAADGTYAVALTVTDNGGASHTKTGSVTVSGSATNVLQNGVAIGGLAASSGAGKLFTLAVPAGATNLRFVTTGGSGDADLYVKFGAAPTTSAYDCRSEGGANAETCSIPTAQAGIYHVLVQAYATYSGLSLTGSYTASGGNLPPTANFTFTTSGLAAAFTDGSVDSDGSIASRLWNFGDGATSTATNPTRTFAAAGTYSVTLTVTDNAGASATRTQSVTVGASNTLQNGVARTGLSAATGAVLSYTMVVPAGATNLAFVIAGGSGDADLYVKFGSAPTTSSYDCRPYANGNSESCPIATAQAGTYYVMVRGYAAFSGLSLTGSYTP